MFDIYKDIDLAYLGEKWQGCYLRFNAIAINELNEFDKLKDITESNAVESVLSILKKKFVEGYAIKQGEKVSVNAEDLPQFPIDILTEVIASFTTGLSKKKLNPSTPTTEE